jgi:hypothetical protein
MNIQPESTETAKERERRIIEERIEILRTLAVNMDEWRGFLRGKVIEHWAEFERTGHDSDKWKAQLYREKLQETLPA